MLATASETGFTAARPLRRPRDVPYMHMCNSRLGLSYVHRDKGANNMERHTVLRIDSTHNDRSSLKAKIHYTSFPVASPWQVGDFPVVSPQQVRNKSVTSWLGQKKSVV